MPQFPSQAIPQKPALVFTSQPSDRGLRGYLDPRHPHAVNSLIVQHLGTEEVVAVVRDDGDVDAFLVRHVVQAIELRAEADSTIGVLADEIRPFFQDNVESSAWGLAIHSQARILATSSNKHEVRVFKFGLIEDGEESPQDLSDEEAEGGQFQSGERRPQGPSSRKQDVRLHVINGNSNIPCIAFCNTGDDPGGRWLLTTDIGGFQRVMDLQQSASSQMFRFGQSFAGANVGGFDRLNAGWAIMFLDKRSFQPEQSLHAALGLGRDMALPKLKDNAGIWDISKTVQNVPDASQAFIYHRPRKRDLERLPLDFRSSGAESVASSTADSRDASVQPSGSSDISDDVEIEIDVGTGEDGEPDDEDGGVDIDIEHHESEDEDADDAMTLAPAQGESDGDNSSDEGEWHIGVVDDDDDPDGEGTEDSVSFTAYYNGDSVCGNEPRFARLEDGTLCEDMPCPILHASVRNLYLLQPSNQQVQPGAWMPPMVGLANPLRQPIQHDFEYLRMFERLNMSAQIPALGVVIVASQKGRALLLSLTRMAKKAEYPPEVEDMASKKTNYGMRIECILPLAEQERGNQRPFAPLHGLAVGPMQGSEEAKEECSRWRVMLMYQDHSILSYEVSRKARSRDSGVDLDILVV